MIRYVAGPEDLGRLRWAISPLVELAASLDALRDPERSPVHAPWAAWARPRLHGLDLALLDAVVPEEGFRPDFVNPPPLDPVPDVRRELARLRATPAEHVGRELGWAYPGRSLPPAAAALVADPARGLTALSALMAAYWERVIAPHWPALLALLEAEVAARAARLAAEGPLPVLGDLHRDVAYAAGTVEVRRPYEATVELGGRGLLLVPAVFTWPRVWAMLDPPWQPAVIYPARGIAGLWAPAARADGALGALLGRRRAALLEALAAPASTRELALRLGASPGGVSEHLSVLRAAGLVTGRRDGRAVRYARTPAGDALVRSAGGA